MIQKVEIVDQDIKITIISTLCMSKQTEQSVSMLKRDRQDTKEVKKDPNWPARDEKYTGGH